MRNILPFPLDYHSEDFNVAIYIRGGASSSSYPEKYYVNLVQYLQKYLKRSPERESYIGTRNLKFHVYHEYGAGRNSSSLCCKAFDKLIQEDDDIDIAMNINSNVFSAFHSWVNADIFITGKTQLGAIAALISNSSIVFSPYDHPRVEQRNQKNIMINYFKS